MLVDRIDRKRSISNARKFLKGYRTIKKLATVNTKHPLHEQAKCDLKCILTTMEQLEDLHTTIINMCYLDSNPKANEHIADYIGYGKTRYNFYKGEALLRFAESYNNQELLAFR